MTIEDVLQDVDVTFEIDNFHSDTVRASLKNVAVGEGIQFSDSRYGFTTMQQAIEWIIQRYKQHLEENK